MRERRASFDNDTSGLQRLIDRMMSDVTREMASDLVVRVLGLRSGKSTRVFRTESEREGLQGLDDGELGAATLAEQVRRATVDQALGTGDAEARAAAWNAVAMAVGPGDAWPLGATFVRDGDARVRFYQYKALAREASAATLAQLSGRGARPEGGPAPLRARRRLALERRDRLSAQPQAQGEAETPVTNGTTTSP